MSITAAECKKKALEWYEHFWKFDPTNPDYLALVDPNIVYRVDHNVFNGPEGIATILKMAKFLYPTGQTREFTSVIAEGNEVSTEITVRAVTNKGTDYENFYAVHFKFNDDGTIAEIFEHPDSAYCLEMFSYDGFQEYMATP